MCFISARFSIQYFFLSCIQKQESFILGSENGRGFELVPWRTLFPPKSCHGGCFTGIFAAGRGRAGGVLAGQVGQQRCSCCSSQLQAQSLSTLAATAVWDYRLCIAPEPGCQHPQVGTRLRQSTAARRKRPLKRNNSSPPCKSSL